MSGSRSCGYLIFEEMTKAFPKFPLLKLNTAQVVYDSTVVVEHIRPQPDQCRFISVQELNRFISQIPPKLFICSWKHTRGFRT